MTRFRNIGSVPEPGRPYHHGHLRRALLDSALVLVAEHGPAALSLREVARQADVSHAAPCHHFGDKAGLLTAIATEGWTLLAEALAATARRTEDFAELGVAYVVFAIDHPGHFAVMRVPQLVRPADPDLIAARENAGRLLRKGAAAHGQPGDRVSVLAAWSLVHGLAALLEEGNVSVGRRETVAGLARAAARTLRPG